jgi:hypothetical protein
VSDPPSIVDLQVCECVYGTSTLRRQPVRGISLELCRINFGNNPFFGKSIADTCFIAMTRPPLQLLLSLVLLAIPCSGAECARQKVDGWRYCGFARSLASGKYYTVQVIFDGRSASVRLDSGTTLKLMLEQEVIEDPEEILARDQSGRRWALSIDDIEKRSRPQRDPPGLLNRI